MLLLGIGEAIGDINREQRDRIYDAVGWYGALMVVWVVSVTSSLNCPKMRIHSA